VSQELPELPEECKEYRKLTLEVMEEIIPYHQMRLQHREGTEEFDSAHKKIVLRELESDAGSKRFSAFFECLNNIGLFDNAEEEARNLGLVE